MTTRKKSYFISDIHLGAPYVADAKAHEARIVQWLESIAPTAKQLFLLGDILDYWYEYRYTVPRGFVRFFGALASLADSGVKIYWFRGNHDTWLFDYLQSEIGLTVIDGVMKTNIDGHKFLLEHGDGVGDIPKTYRAMHSTFRNRIAQFLYASIHPRWTIAFAKNWSGNSRKSQPQPNHEYLQKDITRLENYATSILESGENVDYFVFGHLHSPLSISLKNGSSHLEILGECYTQFVCGVWDGTAFHLEKF